jgi:hypothetical protein
VELTRTLLQVGDYFIDLFDAKSPDTHIYDYPLHSFGTLSLSGVSVERLPIDLFGNKPGIPGYDQLTEIFSGETDTSWSNYSPIRRTYRSRSAEGRRCSRQYTTIRLYKQMVSKQFR